MSPIIPTEAGYVLLPAFAEPHAHLDKAFLAERVDNPTGDLMGAIDAMARARGSITLATEPPGVTVTLHRIEGVDRRLVPVSPTEVPPAPRTPIDHLALPAGTALLPVVTISVRVDIEAHLSCSVTVL